MSENDKQDCVFTNDDITNLTDGERTEELRKTIIGYPTRPLYRELARLLYDWMINRLRNGNCIVGYTYLVRLNETYCVDYTYRHCPIEDLPTYDLLDEKTYVTARYLLN